MSIQYSRGRPWAFIGGGGAFAYVHHKEKGWTLISPFGLGVPMEAEVSDYLPASLLTYLASEWERVPADSNVTRINSPSYPVHYWGRSMTPVFPDEKLNFNMTKESTR